MVHIPAYYVDRSIGLELLDRIKNVSSFIREKMAIQEGSEPLTRVTLFPPEKPNLDPWQFALIIIGVVIVASLVIICKSFLNKNVRIFLLFDRFGGGQQCHCRFTCGS